MQLLDIDVLNIKLRSQEAALAGLNDHCHPKGESLSKSAHKGQRQHCELQLQFFTWLLSTFSSLDLNKDDNIHALLRHI